MAKDNKLHECKDCSAVYTNKKVLVKHARKHHPVKKEKKSISHNKLVHCPIFGCTWKTNTGGLRYHTEVHHERQVKF